MATPTTSWSGTRRSFPSRTARAIRARDGQCMLRYPGCTGGADEADHIIGHAAATKLGWTQQEIDDPSNGQAVCRPCHDRKTAGERAAGQQAARQQRSKLRPREQHPGFR